MYFVKAWWVLPIDDDEFLYISTKYNNSVNEGILSLQEKYKNMNLLSIGWRNFWPEEFKETRTCSLIMNANCWSNYVCEKIFPYWRQDNRWTKTFTKTTCKWNWGKYNGGHQPTILYKQVEAISENDIIVKNGSHLPPINNDDMFIAHYQYKSNDEWLYKCARRKSPANTAFNKNKPEVYKKLYEYKENFIKFNGLKELWQKQ